MVPPVRRTAASVSRVSTAGATRLTSICSRRLLDGLVGHRAEVDDAGDVQHRVEAVEVGHPDRGRVGEVGGEGLSAGEALRQLGGARLAAGQQHQVVAARGEPVGHGGADAGAGAGDQWVRVIG